MRASSCARQPDDSRAQSALFGVRCCGSCSSVAAISARPMPSCCAARMNATRRSVARG